MLYFCVYNVLLKSAWVSYHYFDWLFVGYANIWYLRVQRKRARIELIFHGMLVMTPWVTSSYVTMTTKISWKTWSPMWVPWLPLSFQLFNKLPNNALLRFPPFWSSVSGFTAHSHFSSASSHIQSPLSNHRFWQQGRDWSTIYVPLQSSQILHSKNEKRDTQILLMNVQRKLAALQSCLAQCDQSSMY